MKNFFGFNHTEFGLHQLQKKITIFFLFFVSSHVSSKHRQPWLFTDSVTLLSVTCHEFVRKIVKIFLVSFFTVLKTMLTYSYTGWQSRLECPVYLYIGARKRRIYAFSVGTAKVNAADKTGIWAPLVGFYFWRWMIVILPEHLFRTLVARLTDGHN